MMAPVVGLPFHDDSYYELVHADPPVTWKQAVDLASSKQLENCHKAHLATITSAEEQTAVSGLMEPLTENGWLGGFQPDDEMSLDQGWEWITGEAFEFTYWSTDGEPNDGPYGSLIPGSEQGLEIFQVSGFWNDAPKDEPKYYFIVEYEDCQ